jgi:MFS family permease
MRRFRVSNTVLLIICLMYQILYVDRVNISTAAPLIKADLDLSNTQFGLAFSVFAYPYALLQLVGGYLGDIFGAPDAHRLRDAIAEKHISPEKIASVLFHSAEVIAIGDYEAK